MKEVVLGSDLVFATSPWADRRWIDYCHYQVMYIFLEMCAFFCTNEVLAVIIFL